LLLVLFSPAILIVYILKSAIWLVIIPLLTIILALAVAALPSRRKITLQQFADELEKHLLGTGGPFENPHPHVTFGPHTWQRRLVDCFLALFLVPQPTEVCEMIVACLVFCASALREAARTRTANADSCFRHHVLL
jgi:hypothetical protein